MPSSATGTEQPWKTWYSVASEVASGYYFVWPTLLAGNGPGNGAEKVLALNVDLSKPKEKPQ